jgi:ABC-type multidrug transport system fused ATPase/permease subunit
MTMMMTFSDASIGQKFPPKPAHVQHFVLVPLYQRPTRRQKINMCKGDTPQQVKPKPLPTIQPYGANAVEVEGLTFSYDQSPSNDAAAAPILNNLDLKLPTGSRCLLLGE